VVESIQDIPYTERKRERKKMMRWPREDLPNIYHRKYDHIEHDMFVHLNQLDHDIHNILTLLLPLPRLPLCYDFDSSLSLVIVVTH